MARRMEAMNITYIWNVTAFLGNLPPSSQPLRTDQGGESDAESVASVTL